MTLGTRAIKPGDETAVVPDVWTDRASELRDELLAAYARHLLPGELTELTRCRRFEPGMVVRKETVKNLQNMRKEIKARITAKERDKAEAAVAIRRSSAAGKQPCVLCTIRMPREGHRVCNSCENVLARARRKASAA